MPIIKSAKKKMRQDRKRTVINAFYISAYKELIRKIRKGGKNAGKLISELYACLDKATKKRIIHKNKANRLKSRISKLAIQQKKN